MEVDVIKTAPDGTMTKEKQTVTGEKDYKAPENYKEFKGRLVERTENLINTKDGKKLMQVIFKDEADDRGAFMALETFSPTDDAVISKLMDTKDDIHLYYEAVSNNYGTKFKIKAIQLPDGTWTAPKAKEAWKKGNAVNNRALAVQSAAAIVAGQTDLDSATEITLEIAKKFYEWINEA